MHVWHDMADSCGFFSVFVFFFAGISFHNCKERRGRTLCSVAINNWKQTRGGLRLHDLVKWGEGGHVHSDLGADAIHAEL